MPELSNHHLQIDLQIPEDYALVSIAPSFAFFPSKGLEWRVVAALSYSRMEKEGDQPSQAGTVGTGFGRTIEEAFLAACQRCEEALVQRREAMEQLVRATKRSPASPPVNKFSHMNIEVDL